MAITRLLGTSGGGDLFGITTINATWHAPTLAEVIAFFASLPVVEGLPMVKDGGTFDQDETGEYVIKTKHEGFPPDGEPADIVAADFSFEGSMEKERIETHPKYLSLKETFGWDEENKMFPLIAPETAEEDGLSGGGEDDEPQASPVAGVDSWLVVNGEYTLTFAARRVPSNTFLGVGAIVTRPPGIGAFNLNLGKRSFLKLLPRVNRRGNAVQITLRYQLSGPRGIPKEIYSAGQLDPDADGGETDPIDLPITL